MIFCDATTPMGDSVLSLLFLWFFFLGWSKLSHAVPLVSVVKVMFVPCSQAVLIQIDGLFKFESYSINGLLFIQLVDLLGW